MGDGRDIPLDRAFIPHAIAYAANWFELDKNKFIPDYTSNQLPLDSIIHEVFQDQSISEPLRAVNQFTSGNLGFVWMPGSHILGWMSTFRLASPQPFHPTGYKIIVSKSVFECFYARRPEARALSGPYHMLVSKILDEVRKQESILVV